LQRRLRRATVALEDDLMALHRVTSDSEGLLRSTPVKSRMSSTRG
jgi:hypothetical protein